MSDINTHFSAIMNIMDDMIVSGNDKINEEQIRLICNACRDGHIAHNNRPEHSLYSNEEVINMKDKLCRYYNSVLEFTEDTQEGGRFTFGGHIVSDTDFDSPVIDDCNLFKNYDSGEFISAGQQLRVYTPIGVMDISHHNYLHYNMNDTNLRQTAYDDNEIKKLWMPFTYTNLEDEDYECHYFYDDLQNDLNEGNEPSTEINILRKIGEDYDITWTPQSIKYKKVIGVNSVNPFYFDNATPESIVWEVKEEQLHAENINGFILDIQVEDNDLDSLDLMYCKVLKQLHSKMSVGQYQRWINRNIKRKILKLRIKQLIREWADDIIEFDEGLWNACDNISYSALNKMAIKTDKQMRNATKLTNFYTNRESQVNHYYSVKKYIDTREYYEYVPIKKSIRYVED